MGSLGLNSGKQQHLQPHLDGESDLERSPPPNQPDTLHLAASKSCQGAVSDVCLLQNRDGRVGRGQVWRELGEGTASEGEKSAEKLAVHAESLGEDGKQVISLCTELFEQLVPHR